MIRNAIRPQLNNTKIDSTAESGKIKRISGIEFDDWTRFTPKLVAFFVVLLATPYRWNFDEVLLSTPCVHHAQGVLVS